MTSEKLKASLNALMNGQLEAYHFYLQGAAWSAARSFTGLQGFLLKQASDELSHMHLLFGYLTDVGAPVTFTALPQPVISANAVKGLFEAVRDLELKVTQSVNQVYDLANAEKDHATASFLKQFIDGQHAENAQCRFMLDRIDLIGNGPDSLYLIDREFSALANGKGASAA